MPEVAGAFLPARDIDLRLTSARTRNLDFEISRETLLRNREIVCLFFFFSGNSDKRRNVGRNYRVGFRACRFPPQVVISLICANKIAIAVRNETRNASVDVALSVHSSAGANISLSLRRESGRHQFIVNK